jgi:hypothetical protein
MIFAAGVPGSTSKPSPSRSSNCEQLRNSERMTQTVPTLTLRTRKTHSSSGTRISFRSFYDNATPDDALWMDALVLGFAAFVKNTVIPRQVLPERLRAHVERTGNEVEHVYMKVRDQVRRCSTFKNLPVVDRQRIATVLFDPFSPAI